MDAIIYFRKRRGLKQWKIVFVRQEDYLLVRVDVDAGKERWFGQELPVRPLPPGEAVAGGWLRKRRERRAKEREYQARQLAYELFVRSLEEEIRQLREEIEKILRRTNMEGETGCVYERELSFLTREDNLTGEIWNRIIYWPQFRDYAAFRWMRPLLEEVRETEFLILGFAENIPLILEHLARRMRELRWYLEQDEHTAEAEDMAEDFFIEYGLAVSVCILEGRHPFRRAGLSSENPVCILDFSEEEKILPVQLAAGSVWIDFRSIEGKEKRLGSLAPEVRYISLKKRWRMLKPKSRRAPDFAGALATEDRPGYNPELRLG